MSYNPRIYNAAATTVPISLKISRPGTTEGGRAYTASYVYSGAGTNQINGHIRVRSTSRSSSRNNNNNNNNTNTPAGRSEASADFPASASRPPSLPAPASPQLRSTANDTQPTSDAFLASTLRVPQQPLPPALPVPLPGFEPPTSGIWSVSGSDSLPKRGTNQESSDWSIIKHHHHPSSPASKMVAGVDSLQRWKTTSRMTRPESSSSFFPDLTLTKSADYNGLLWKGEFESSSSSSLRPFAPPPSVQLPLLKRHHGSTPSSSFLLTASPPASSPSRWPDEDLYKPRLGGGDKDAFPPNSSSSIIETLLRSRQPALHPQHSRNVHSESILLRETDFLTARRSLAKTQDAISPQAPQIVDVWSHNLEEEFVKIRDVVERYQYVAMDTEFPGVVARPTGSCSDYHYKTIKYNVDLLKVIQLGITFADEKGRLPTGTSTWQFNFKFDLERDMYAEDAIKFLQRSGIDFKTHQNNGIEIQEFGEVIMSSGLVMNKAVKWISFHGSYDFGYLLKLLTCAPLPDSEKEFFELLRDFFPSLYDIKYLLIHCENSKNESLLAGSSLQRVAEHLEVQRVGPQHQAGSDSLVTCRTFFRLMEAYFDNLLDDSKFSGVIYGFGDTGPTTRRPQLPQGGETEWYDGGHDTPPTEELADAVTMM